MSRLTAWVILVAGAGLVFSLAFTGYDHRTDRWRSTDSGGLVRVTVECPAPWRVLLFGAEPVDVANEDLCVGSSRTLALEAAVAAIATGLLVWSPVTRRKPTSIEPLSKKISPPWGSPRD